MSRPTAHCEPSARSRRTIQLRCCADKQGGALENGRVRRAPKPWKDRGAYTWKPGAPRRPCLSVAHEGGAPLPSPKGFHNGGDGSKSLGRVLDQPWSRQAADQAGRLTKSKES